MAEKDNQASIEDEWTPIDDEWAPIDPVNQSISPYVFPKAQGLSSPIPSLYGVIPEGFRNPDTMSALDTLTQSKDLLHNLLPAVPENAPPNTNYLGMLNRVGEQTFGELAQTVGGLGKMGRDLYQQYIDPTYQAPPTSEWQELGKRIVQEAKEKYPLERSPVGDTLVNATSYLGAQFAPMVVAAPLNVLAKGSKLAPLVETLSRASPALNTIPRQYERGREQGLSTGEAATKALGHGAVQAILNQKVFDPSMAGGLNQVGTGAALGFVGETGDISLDQLYGLKDPRTIPERLLGTTVASGAIQIPITAGSRLLNSTVNRIADVRRAATNAEQLNRIQSQIDALASEIPVAQQNRTSIDIKTEPLPLSRGLPEPRTPVDIKIGRELGSEAPLLGLPRSPTDVGPEGTSQWTTNVRNVQDLNLPRNIGPEGVNQYVRGDEALQAYPYSPVMPPSRQIPNQTIPNYPRDIGPEGANQFIRGQEAIAQPGPDVQSPILDEFGQPIQREFAPRDLTLSEPPKPESTIIQSESVSGGPRNTYSQTTQNVVNKWMRNRQRGATLFGGKTPKAPEEYVVSPDNPEEFIPKVAETPILTDKDVQALYADRQRKIPATTKWFQGETDNLLAGTETGQQYIKQMRDLFPPFPSTLLKKFPQEVESFYSAAENVFRNTSITNTDFYNTLKPSLDLSPQESSKLDMLYEAVKRANRPDLMTPENLNKMGFSEKQIAAVEARNKFIKEDSLDTIKEVLNFKAEKLSPELRAAALDKINADIEDLRGRFYFPQRRWGDHVMVLRDDNGQVIGSWSYDKTKKGLPPQIAKVLKDEVLGQGWSKDNVEFFKIGNFFTQKGEEVGLDLFVELAKKDLRFYSNLLEKESLDGAFHSNDEILRALGTTRETVKGLKQSHKDIVDKVGKLIIPEGTFARLIHRRDIPGYELDINRALGDYAQSLAYWKGKTIGRKEFLEAKKVLGYKAGEQPELKKYMQDYQDYILGGGRDTFPLAQKAMAATFLGANLKSSLILQNAQYLTNTWPELMFGDESVPGLGAGKGTLLAVKAWFDAAFGKIAPETFAKKYPDLSKAIENEIKAGGLGSKALTLFSEGSVNKFAKNKGFKGAISKASDLALSPFTYTDSFVRVASFIADWHRKQKGVFYSGTGADLPPVQRAKQAQRFSDYTNFSNAPVDRYPAFRGGPLNLISLFKSYAGHMIRLQRNSLGEKNFKKFIAQNAALTLVGGAASLPFIYPVWQAAKAAGIDPAGELNDYIDENIAPFFGSKPYKDPDLGKRPSKVAQAFTYGLPHALDLINLTGSGMMGPAGQIGQDPLSPYLEQVGAPVTTMLNKYGKAISYLAKGDLQRAIEWGMPLDVLRRVMANDRIGKQFVNAQGQVETEGFTTPTGEKLINPTSYERTLYALGGTPPRMTEAYALKDSLSGIADKARPSTDLYAELVSALNQQDQERAKKITKAIIENDGDLSESSLIGAFLRKKLGVPGEILNLPKKTREEALRKITVPQ